jgi:hypothetical protein
MNRMTTKNLNRLLSLLTCVLIFNLPRTARADGPITRLHWLHEGTLVTYSWYAATAPGNGSDYQEDADGDWVNPTTGQRYSRTTQQGNSGTGFSQMTIACIDGSTAIISTQSFGNAGLLGRNVPVPLQGGTSFITPVDQCDDYWIDPQKLANIHTDASTGMLVTGVQWKTAAGAIDAIRIQKIAGGNFSLHVYDPKTGLCLHYASAVHGTAPRLVGPGDFGQGDVTLSQGDFISTRDLAIPWSSENIPDAILGLKALHYRGQTTSTGILPTTPNDIAIDLTFATHGRNWAQLNAITHAQIRGLPPAPPANSQIAFGHAQFGGLWAGTTALASLHQGQVLDEDPITKMKTIVSAVDANSIIIAQQNAAGEIDSRYDKATGLMTGSSFVNVLSQEQITITLQSRE